MNPVLRIAIIILAVPPATLFPILYARRPWRATLPGRALMTKAVANMLLVDTAALGWVYPQSTITRALSVAGALLFTTGLWFLLIALLTTPREVGD